MHISSSYEATKANRGPLWKVDFPKPLKIKRVAVLGRNGYTPRYNGAKVFLDKKLIGTLSA